MIERLESHDSVRAVVLWARRKGRRIAALPPPAMALMLAVLLTGLPAAAQTAEGPNGGVSPDGATYTSSGSSITIPVTVVFTDPDGVNGSTLQVALWKGSTSVPVSLVWSTNFDGVQGTATGRMDIVGYGEHRFVAQVADKLGNVGTAEATFTLVQHNPDAPIVAPDGHHNGFRDTTQGAFVLPYASSTYTSGGAARGVTLVYNSQQAHPDAVVSLDARAGASNDHLLALSGRIERWQAGSTTGTLVGREVFYAKSSGFQRMVARWNMNVPTGAYKYWAVVRAHFDDRPPVETRTLVRVLVINEGLSRFGAGWSLAGVQRLHEADDGVMLNEGNGIARFFEKTNCAGSYCTYVTPAGDFTRLVYNGGTVAPWVRIYKDGSTVTFSSAGLMTAASDRFGNTTTYEWQNTQYEPRVPVIVRITDPIGYATTFVWGSDGYLYKMTHGGRTVSFLYTADRDISEIVGPPSLRLTYDKRMPLTMTSHYSTASVVDPGAAWKMAFDRHRRVSTIVSPTVTANGYSSRPQRNYRSLELATIVATTAGTGLDNLATPIASDAAIATVTDAEGHKTEMTVDRYGNPTRVVDALGNVTTITWNPDGLPERVSNPTTFTVNVWDEGNLLLSTVNGTPVYEASYNSQGFPEFVMNGRDASWYEYGGRNQVVRTWYGKRQDFNRTGTTYEYNARYQLTAVVDPKGARAEWSYENNPWKNADTVRIFNSDGSITTTTYTFDERSRVRTVTNALSETTTTEYDDLNRPLRVLDAAGRSTWYQYTGPFLTKVTDAAGKSYEYAYNALGWLDVERFPDGGSRTYRYNRDGLRVSSTDRRGMVVSHSFDALHRPAGRVADGLTTTFQYPDVFTQVITNPESTVTIKTVPDVGSLESISSTLAGKRFEIKRVFEYEDARRDIGFDLNTWVDGEEKPRRTDKMRFKTEFRPADVTLGVTYSLTDFSNRVSTIHVDTAGRPVRVTLPNGTTTTNSFAPDGRLNATTFNVPTVNERLGATYAWDFLNRLNTRTTMAEDRYWAYAYDSVGQVTTYGLYRDYDENCTRNCLPPGAIRQEAYSYDLAGNRTDRGGTVIPGTNRYSHFNGFNLEYDAEGNLTRKYKAGFEQHFTWNALGQLTGVTTNGVLLNYGYDGLGRRVRRQSLGAPPRYFLYNGDDLLMEADANGEPLRTYTHWPGVDNPHSVRVTSNGQQATYFYVTEHPGHVTGLVNEAGFLAAEYRYTPWGEVESASDPTEQPLRFMAREHDPANGLYYVRARWYDPDMARFISQDPIGLAGGMNTYAYAGNDPVNDRDPSGLHPCFDNPFSAACVEAAVNLLLRLFRGAGSGRAGTVEESSTDVQDPEDRTWEPSSFDDWFGRSSMRSTGGSTGGEKTEQQEAIDCAVNAFEADVQAGLFASKTAKFGVVGFSASADAGSLHVGLREGHVKSWFTWGLYGDITRGGFTFPIGFKLELELDATSVTGVSIRWGAEKPSFDVPLAGGGGVLVGAQGTFKAGDWFKCWVETGAP
jgi:RHS repeat-associated protein